MIDLTGANDYFESRLNSDAWDDASDGDKNKALFGATQIIDRLNFIGEKTDDDQNLQFPRDGEVDIPSDISIACYEIAIKLLEGFDIDREIRTLMATSQRFVSVSESYDRSFIPEHLVAGVPSALAWNYLKPYLRDPKQIILERV